MKSLLIPAISAWGQLLESSLPTWLRPRLADRLQTQLIIADNTSVTSQVSGSMHPGPAALTPSCSSTTLPTSTLCIVETGLPGASSDALWSLVTFGLPGYQVPGDDESIVN